jgi:hypothetical protein
MLTGQIPICPQGYETEDSFERQTRGSRPKGAFRLLLLDPASFILAENLSEV